MQTLSRLRTSIVLILLLAGCGGGRGGVLDAPDANDSAGIASTPAAVPSETTLAEDLAALDALPVPSGVDPATFAQLKATLRDMLLSKGVSKIATQAPTGYANVVDDLELTDKGNGTYMLKWTYKNIGDYDQNGQVNISDITPIGMYFGKTPSSPGWDVAKLADGDGNGEVNIADLTPIGAHFHSFVKGYRLHESRLFDGPLLEVIDVTLADAKTVSQIGGAKYFECQLPVSEADHTWVVPMVSDTLMGVPSDIMPVVGGGADSSSTIKVSSKVEQLDDATVGLITIAPDGTVLTIPKTAISAERLDSKPILVSTADQGFVKKVASYTDHGSDYEVQVETAGVAELFDRAIISFNREIKAEDIERTISQLKGVKQVSSDSNGFDFSLFDVVLWDADGNDSTTNDQVVANGTISVDQPRFDFFLDVTNFMGIPTGVREFRFALTENTEANVTVSADLNVQLIDNQLRLITYGLIPFDVNLGFMKLSLGPELGLNVGLKADASVHFETGVTATATTTLGLDYLNGQWTTVQSFNKGFDYTEPQLYGKAGLKAYFGPEFNINILGGRLVYVELGLD